MFEDPAFKKFTTTETIVFGGPVYYSSLPIEFERCQGIGMVDTEVKIKGTFCITWDDKDKFKKEFEDLVKKYFI